MALKKNDLCKESIIKMQVWTHAMDVVLADAFLNQYNMGLKVTGTFISNSYDNIVEELAKTSNITVEKNQVKNRCKIL